MGSKRRIASLAATVAMCLVTVGVSAAVAPSAGAAGSNTLTVKAGEYTYKFSGSAKAGWTQITFDNSGNENHMMAVIPLKKGVTVAQLKKAALSSDQSAFGAISSSAQVYGAPNIVGPGEATTVITELPAGHYGVLCFFTAPDGAPHVAHGMVKTFDVSSAKSSLTPPADGLVTVSVADDTVTIPASGLPAHGWAKVTNNSSTPRDLTIARYATATTTFDEASAYVNAFSAPAPAGTPPVVLQGGAQPIAPGGTAYVQLDLKSGKYAFVSDTDDDQDGSKLIHVDVEVK